MFSFVSGIIFRLLDTISLKKHRSQLVLCSPRAYEYLEKRLSEYRVVSAFTPFQLWRKLNKLDLSLVKPVVCILPVKYLARASALVDTTIVSFRDHIFSPFLVAERLGAIDWLITRQE